MAVKSKKRLAKNQKGMAILETIPMIFIFVMLLSFTYGFYGITQRMILSSIAARAYGFEVIRHRANVVYLRDVGPDASNHHYLQTGSRYFTSRASEESGNTFDAEKLDVSFSRTYASEKGGNKDAHNASAYEDLSRQGPGARKRNSKHLFEPVWIKNGYGICLNARCAE